jgi:glycosyltransferase involved in cell wall biosynthesis
MGAPAARSFEHARHWVEQGHDVTVVTGFPNHPDGIIPEEYRGEMLRRETREGVDIVRTWLYAARNAGFAKRVLNFASFSVSSIVSGSLFVDAPDVVVATSPQLLVGVSGAVLARRFDVPFVFEVRDLWPKSAVDLGAIEHPSLIDFAEGIETAIYREAERVVIVSESFREHIVDRGIPSNDIHFIPNGIDPDFLDESVERDVRAEYDLREDFVVGYVGTHGMSHGLDVVLEVARRFQESEVFDDVTFLFVGDGARKPDLQEQAEAWGLDNVTFVPVQPREEIPSFYRACDVCLVPLRDKPVFKTVLPSKMFEIMAVGRPMIVSIGGEAERVVSEGNAGLCIPPESPDELVDAIQTLYADPERRETLATRAESYVWEEFSRPALADRYLELFDDVLETSRRRPRAVGTP